MGGQAPQKSGGTLSVPVATQLRQIERVLDPQTEVHDLKRYAPIGATRLRVEYGPTGPLGTEVLVKGAWLPLTQAEDRLDSHLAKARLEEGLRRAPTRLGRVITAAEYAALPSADVALLALSQREWAFRAPQGALNTVPMGTTAGAPSGAPITAPQGPVTAQRAVSGNP
jgi:hypothetical protein